MTFNRILHTLKADQKIMFALKELLSQYYNIQYYNNDDVIQHIVGMLDDYYTLQDRLNAIKDIIDDQT